MNMTPLTTLTIMLMLTLPIVTTTLTTHKNQNLPNNMKSTILYALLTSMPMTIMFTCYNQEMTISNWHWTTIQTLKLTISLKMDLFSILFIPVALFVTWSIMEFSMWYMHSDPKINQFFKYLLMFLLTMMVLVTANNMLQLFVGWEGVGIMSFLLISWWYGRADANTAALQAIIYNRIGDTGLILSMTWLFINLNTWDLQQIIALKSNITTLPLMGLLLAATGKSAQFGLHPWLPSAMEGPTPVSALLHSSTMVVAGMFLLIRFHPLMENNSTMQTLTLCTGALTTLFTAMCALTQNDIKKIIAFSTSSQLGLMMVTIGINQPYLAFLHICTHAFFKAMLFLSSGTIIHNLNDEQDIRKMGGLFKTMPLTSTSIMVGSLALTGTPFLTGFYSKDLIIETACTSNTNAWALTTTLLATALTAVYSTRMIFLTLLGKPRSPTPALINENNPLPLNAIKRLLVGSIFAGFLISKNIPPITTTPTTMPNYLKLMALSMTLMGFALALELSTTTTNLKLTYPSNPHKFSSLLGYFPIIIHRLMPKMDLTMSQKYASLLLDSAWLESTMPKAISLSQLYLSTLVSSQKGLIKLYFMSFLISLTLIPLAWFLW
uniref:NADH-ubiquinone oxidoreductase chain 5 n=1 Tax=Diphylla ecaudata TaxID=148089 RepID=A0A3G1FHX2_DIPEC|nr:NADH dehydrogenase subunit 5 [Diphylla ecaudata]AOS49753.1 NADH dehydrogenase subunit 5 [Diphylla ecaudata]